MKPTTHERFWSKVRADGQCLVWTASLKGDGYGQFWFGTTVTRAHRWAYEYLMGPVPDGLEIDHLCRNRACVNVAHLEAVTHRENVLRGRSAKSEKTHCPSGHPYSGANLYREPGTSKRRCRECLRAKRAAQ